MRLALPAPRLLPLTIAAMAALLGMKSVALVRAAVPAQAPAASAAAAPAPDGPAAKPAAPPPAAAQGNVPAQPGLPTCLPAATGPEQVQLSDSERGLLLDLRSRRAELDKAADALTTREAALNAAEKRIASRVDELNGLQQRLEALEAARKEHEEANWRGLVKLYENMRPHDAATIFNDLDLAVLLQVLDRMNERKAAPILAAMQPDRARQVTAELARLRTAGTTPASPPSQEKR
jgi:flagellar motility protein MotE (MotC chaperone)